MELSHAVSTYTAAAFSTLAPIEILARQRELAGYDTLNELDELLRRCSERPQACRVVLPGPDTLFIAQSTAAVDFLLNDVGFVRRSGVSGAQQTASANEYTLVMPGYDSGSLTENTAEWRVCLQRITNALRLVEWAKWANTSLLKIKLYDLEWSRDPGLPCAVEAKVKWVDVLGHSHGDLFKRDGYRYAGQRPSSFCLVLESSCDAECEMSVDFFQQRVLFPKHVGRAWISYTNTNVMTDRIPIYRSGIDPSRALTPEEVLSQRCGSISVEIWSIRHRYAQLAQDMERHAAAVAATEPSSSTTAHVDTTEQHRNGSLDAQPRRLEEPDTMERPSARLNRSRSVASDDGSDTKVVAVSEQSTGEYLLVNTAAHHEHGLRRRHDSEEDD